jgi:hypothetical protein
MESNERARGVMERIEIDDPARVAEWVQAGDWVADELRQSLQVLAADAQGQVDFYPPRSDIIGELVTDCLHFAETIVTYWVLSSNQALQLKTLADFFDALDNPDEDVFWTVQALYDDARWDEARRLAKQALLALEWPVKGRERER